MQHVELSFAVVDSLENAAKTFEFEWQPFHRLFVAHANFKQNQNTNDCQSRFAQIWDRAALRLKQAAAEAGIDKGFPQTIESTTTTDWVLLEFAGPHATTKHQLALVTVDVDAGAEVRIHYWIRQERESRLSSAVATLKASQF